MVLVICSLSLYGQPPFRKIKNEAFKPGEILEYRIHYGFIDAGIARLEIKKDFSTINNRKCYHVVGTGETKGAFDWFFKVRDRYESYIDAESLMPWIFIRSVEEGSFSKSQNVTFNHFKKSATSEKVTIPVPEYVQDLVSAFFYARNLDFTNANLGAMFPISTYLDDEVFEMNIKYIGKGKSQHQIRNF